MDFHPDDKSDARLAEAAAAGDEAAFNLLFDRHYAAVRDYAIRMVFDRSDGEDIAQETFVRAARSIRNLANSAAVRSWLFRIAANLARDFVRRREARRKHLGAFAAEAAHGESAAGDDFDALDAALQALPARQREAVLLVFFQNLTHREAACALGCAETTVSWRLMLARRTLKKLLTP